MNAVCVRCQAEAPVPYGARFYCFNCGFTFHRDSTDEFEELNRRRENERAGIRRVK